MVPASLPVWLGNVNAASGAGARTLLAATGGAEIGPHAWASPLSRAAGKDGQRRRYWALLRAIANVGMHPFRRALEELGFADVRSYGASGNLLFTAKCGDAASLERRIAARLGTAALVRTRPELARVVARDPLGSIVLFLAGTPTAARRRAFLALDFEAPRPVLSGKTVYYVYPARLRGRRTPVDLERALGVRGTFRTARVVGRLLALISEES